MDEEYIKDFEGWHPLKQHINNEEKIPDFRTKEIWWCSTGINIGIEQDGKNHLYERPVLIVRKFNRRLFWGVPITSQLKDFPFHHPIYYKAFREAETKERRAIISQMRAYDSIRLSRPMAKLEPQQFREILTIIKGGLK